MFTPKSYAPLDELAALDLNDMDGNDDHVREEANYVPLLYVREATYERTLATISYRLYIDTGPIGTLITSTGDKSQADIDISAVTVGLHTLEIPALALKGRFYKTPDMTYLTFWLTVKATVDLNPAANGPYLHRIENMTVVGHREPKSWT